MCRSVASQWQSTRSTCFARHLAEFFRRQFTADDALAKGRVSLVFQVDEQGPNFFLATRIWAAKLRMDCLFDSFCATDDQVNR